MSFNRRTFVRYYFPVVVSALLFTFLLPASSQAATRATPTETGRIYGPMAEGHPTPKRVYLVTRDASRIPKDGSAPSYTGRFTVTFSDLSVYRFAVCKYEDSSNCIWPARLVGNGKGRSFVQFRGKTRPFPSRMIRPAYPLG